MSAPPAELGKQTRVIDLFCGAGGLSYGLKQAGLDIRAGVDLDPASKYPYEENVGATFHLKDVASLTADDLTQMWGTGDGPRVLAGCAPCQPFSTYTQGLEHDEDKRWSLVDAFARLAVSSKPEVVTMENVGKLRQHPRFQLFVDRLKESGYRVWSDVVRCSDFGVPQTRRRLVLLAALEREPRPLVGDSTLRSTVRETIGNLPPLTAGQTHGDDPLHRAARLTARNLERLQASKAGGTWKDWPESLRANCHRKATCTSYVSVYGRMTWDEPAPTITTEAYGIGHGRFGHPDQDRAISLREASLLQTFPATYTFSEPGTSVKFANVGRLIGNAVPVKLGKAIGDTIRQTLTEQA